MSITATEKISATDDAGSASVGGSLIAVGTTLQTINQSFAAGSSNASFAITFAHATLKYLLLVSNQNMTILVNSTGSPILTINLIAGIPYRWNSSDGYFSNPLSADVTTFFVSCTPAATLKGKVLN